MLMPETFFAFAGCRERYQGAAVMWGACLAQGPQKVVHIQGSEVGFFHHRSKGVDWVFVDHPSYPRPGGIYADQFGVYGDNQVCASALLCSRSS